jgi:hypothetical protein
MPGMLTCAKCGKVVWNYAYGMPTDEELAAHETKCKPVAAFDPRKVKEALENTRNEPSRS